MKYVALVYARNNCYTTVMTLDETGVSVVAGTWWTLAALAGHPLIKLNEARHLPYGQRYGIIGVFDTTLTGLNAMLHAAQAATDDGYYGD